MTAQHDEKKIPEHEKYRSNPLTCFDNGCLLDLRVKLAIDFLKSPMYATDVEHFYSGSDMEEVKPPEIAPHPRTLACHALDLATELLAEGTRRGLVEPIPDHDELSAPIRKQIRRGVRANVISQIVASALMAEETRGQVQPVAAMPAGARLDG